MSKGRRVVSFRGRAADDAVRVWLKGDGEMARLVRELRHVADEGTCPRCGGRLTPGTDGGLWCDACMAGWGVGCPGGV